MTELKTASLIPETNAHGAIDYLCTWCLQGKAAKALSIPDGPGGVHFRDALTDESLFGKDSVYHVFEDEYIADVLFVLDDGWDVPFGTKNIGGEPRPYGACDPDGEKFPRYGETPAERLTKLSVKVKAMGYRGLGLWISPQMSGETSSAPHTLDEAREYWTERAKWCDIADIRYFKVDWGVHNNDPEYLTMLSEVMKTYAPNVMMEFAYCQMPYNAFTDIAKRKEFMERMLPHADVIRLYDNAVPFEDVTILSRADEILSVGAAAVPQNGALGHVNAEICTSVAAALGLAVGSMCNYKEPNTSDKACIRWHRAAPPFSVFEGNYTRSEEILTDEYFFDKNYGGWHMAKGKRITESAPCIMARGCELPRIAKTYLADIKPYVMASKNPITGAYTIATLKRVMNPNRSLIAPADIEFKVGSPSDTVGIFGYYNSLTLIYGEDISEYRILAQDILGNTPEDITDRVSVSGRSITLSGDDLRLIGTSARSNEDAAEPALALKLIRE